LTGSNGSITDQSASSTNCRAIMTHCINPLQTSLTALHSFC
jgi:hypothetical protein